MPFYLVVKNVQIAVQILDILASESQKSSILMHQVFEYRTQIVLNKFESGILYQMCNVKTFKTKL